MDKKSLRSYTTIPINAGSDMAQLHRAFITPAELFFIRNHGDIPASDPDEYRLEVNGLVGQALRLSLDDLNAAFPPHTVVATLQCAGNRRRELAEFRPIDRDEIIWDVDAIGTAEWTGVRLCDVLAAAGVGEGAAHVAFAGLDMAHRVGDVFGGSIPLDKALSPDVLLASRMNGEALPPEHGYPLRVLVPGYIGARSVKWLASISVQAEPSDNYYQARAYKLFPPDVSAETADPEQGVMLGELPINAVICEPVHQAHLHPGPNPVRGLAIGSGSSLIERVEVSCDGGSVWKQAELGEQRHPWACCLWQVSLELAPGKHCLMVRAFDSAGQCQPEEIAEVWNFKGYANNAWHRIEVQVGDA